MSKLLENLWLGDIQDAHNTQFIKSNNINVIVNCTKGLSFIDLPIPFKYRIPVNDDLQEQSFQEMYIALTYIIPVLVTHISRGDRILIHCYAGVQRSAIVTLALLTALTYPNMSCIYLTEETLQQFCMNLKTYISEYRPIVFTPHMNFKKSYSMWLQYYLQQSGVNIME